MHLDETRDYTLYYSVADYRQRNNMHHLEHLILEGLNDMGGYRYILALAILYRGIDYFLRQITIISLRIFR